MPPPPASNVRGRALANAQAGAPNEEERRQRLEQHRAERQMFDTVPIGGRPRPAPKSSPSAAQGGTRPRPTATTPGAGLTGAGGVLAPNPPLASLGGGPNRSFGGQGQAQGGLASLGVGVGATTARERDSRLDQAPVYRFQIAEVFEHDVPKMRNPTSVLTKSLQTTTPSGFARQMQREGRETMLTGVNAEGAPLQPGQRRVVPLPDQLLTQATLPKDMPVSVAEGGGDDDGALVQYDDGLMTQGNSGAGNRGLLTAQPDPDELLMASIQHATAKRPAQTLLSGTDRTQNPIAPNDDQDISKLSGADDVISFFSVHGTSRAVKFVYCNKRPAGLEFQPYALEVVVRGQQHPEHYVVSASGVVHVRPGHAAEVVSLAEWMRESAMFNTLRRVRFFRSYLVYKAFTQWRRNIRLRLYCETRRKLCKTFFLSKQTFASTTVELYKTAHDLTTTPLFHYEHPSKHDYTVEDFNRDQAKARAGAATEFGNTLESIEAHLTKLTDLIQQRANVPDLTTMESLEQYLLANSVATGKDRKTGRKMKSMLEAQHEQYARMRELKRAMAEHAMLGTFIRLIDYITAEKIFRNALLTVLQLYATLASGQRKLGFQILIQPSEAEGVMVYKPSCQELTKTYVDTIEDIVQTVNSVIRLLNQKPLKVFFARPPKLWNVGTEFKRDQRVLTTKTATVGLFTEDFAKAQDPKRKATYDANIRWFAYIKTDWPTRRDEYTGRMDAGEFLTYDEISGEYDHLARAERELLSLTPANIGYTLYVNALRLKNELDPKIKSIRNEVDAMLTTTAQTRTKKLQRYFRDTMTQLSGDKQGLDLRRYADFVSALNEVNDRKAQTDREADEAEALFTLMLEQAVEIDDADRQLRERTLGAVQANGQSLREQFEDMITKATEVCDTKRHQMITALTTEIDRVNDESNNNIHVLNDDDYTQVAPTDRKPQDAVPEYPAVIWLTEMEEKVNTLQERSALYTKYQELFGMPTVPWRELQQLGSLFNARKEAWTLLQQFDEKRNLWWNTPLVQLETPEVEQQVKELHQKAHKLAALMRNENFIDTVAEDVSAAIKHMKQTQLPCLLDCGNNNMRREHWVKVFQQLPTHQPMQYRDDLCLGHLEDCDIWAYHHVVSEQAAMATGEANLTRALDEIDNVWGGIDFVTKKYRDDRDVHILDKVDDIIQQLDDNHIQLQTITASRFVSAVRTKVEEWIAKLRTVSDVLEEWVTMQKNWMYLEFIFSSADIKVQLKEESDRFDVVDKMFKDIMHKAVNVKNVLSICTEPGLLESLIQSNQAIDEIQKRLEDYLETKRVAFPRFYFLSNDELLSILSDVRNPRAVQPHLSKCFDSIAALVFNNEQATEIGGMRSGEGEEVVFDNVVKPVGNVEMWLGVIEATMKSSLLMHTRECFEAYPRRVREDWYFEFPAQCVQAVDMVYWTGEVEQAIQDMDLRNYHARYQQQILKTVDIVKQPLSRLQRTLICTLIVVDVHNRDVVNRLVEADVRDIQDFDWLQQLRYYWEMDTAIGQNSCGIHHCTAKLWYGYEYLGNQPRLVITPLTDRAFLTCTSALEMNLGAAPQGPAGTGKTESVKDLGKALARQVVVFNCSDGINYKTMSRMFAGLAQAGAWACFDEFNRIELEVLSVIAQQMLEIVMALGEKKEHMEFDGHPIKLSKNFGVFITMNPGYAGRTELPDNLKALFRPICMMIPDYALIAEIMFYSEGFSDAHTLAHKMVQLYKLSSEQLSKQDHYDFGMRAVKSILVMAGALKRANPDESEDMLLIRAMRDSNVPKFLREDTVLFMALIRDLFPTIDIRDQNNELLLEYMKKDMAENDLQQVDGFLLKARQLFDTMIVRHGVMTVGQTYCAKTAITETLQRTLSAIKADGHDPEGDTPLYNAVETHVLNPKSVTMGELYGEVNALTREWTDGLLSGIARNIKTQSQTSNNRHWIIFDGPVDAIWIENMNTVLDDNKMLCLFNGERIKLPATASFMFEVQDLKVASPATVSRCGMVYIEPYYLDGGWRPIAQTLVNKYAKVHGDTFRAARMMELLNELVPPTIDFFRKHCKEFIPTVDAQLVASCIELLHGYLVADSQGSLDEDPAAKREQRQAVAGAAKTAAQAEEEEDEEMDGGAPEVDGVADNEVSRVLNAVPEFLREFTRPELGGLKKAHAEPRQLFDMFFVLSFVWSFGANITDATRAAFNDFLSPLLVDMFPSTVGKHETKNIYDLCLHKQSMSFVSWSHVVPNFTYDRSVPYFELFVPTVETTSAAHIMEILVNVGRNVLVNGETGTGKSIITMDMITSSLGGDDPNGKWEYFATAFSAQTRSIDLQERLESKLTKVRNNLLGASPGKRALFFIDDLNMPSLEKFGASPPIELLRQFISQKGCYDRKKVPSTFKEIQDVVFMAACGVPGGGRNELSTRLTSKFHVLCQPVVTTPSMRRIFSTILGGFLGIWPADVRDLTPKIVEAARECYERISSEKLPTPAKSHYTFNLRDFGKVIQGMLQVTPDAVGDRTGMIKLFMHEVSRVFHDRLVDDDDKRWWWLTLSDVSNKHFGVEWERGFESLVFGDFMRIEPRMYEEVPKMSMFQEKLVEYQTSYNVDNNKETELVFFSDAAAHIARICRICRQPRGNALLVGVGGSGRQSLTNLAAYVCGMPLFQIAITRSYGVTEFRDDLKNALLVAGCENKNVVFLLSDTQIVKEQFLEDVNNILNTGEVPNMMQTEDNDKIIESVRKFVKAAGKQETRNVILSQFVQQCRDNFHIVLTMSPIGDQFRRRLRMFPSLVNCTTIDWFTLWPAEALEGVAHRFLDKMSVEEEHKELLAKMCVYIHLDVQEHSNKFFEELRRHNYTTPTSYLELLKSYSKMYDEQNISVGNQLSRYQGGLNKLESTQTLVDEMKISLTKMQPVLDQAKKDVERIIAEVDVKQKEAEVVEEKCVEEQEIAAGIKHEADGVRGECQARLDQAMPAYHGALAALDALNSNDISEIKTLNQPPDRVRVVVEAVLVLLGQKDTSWASCKTVIGRSDFLSSLRNFDKDNVPDRVIRTLQTRYINNKDVEFTPENVEKASKACKSLCMWARAIDNYNSVAKTIAPKRIQLAEAEAKLADAEASLKSAQDSLQVVKDNVAALRKTMQENIDRRKTLEDEMELTRLRLGRAEKLMTGLASEQVRWSDSVAKLNVDRTELVGTMILAAGCVAYLGPFTAPYRQHMMLDWAQKCNDLKIPVSGTSFSLADVADPVNVRRWASKGLPMDNFSVENGVILSRSQRWCLCIDPQGQANAFIRNMERDNDLKIIKLSEPSAMKTLENAIRVGLPVLLENVDENIDAAIDPVLLRQTFRANGQLMLKLGDQEIEYDAKFRFYITTKLPNPHFMPELQIKVTIANFTVTQRGLGEQLLADVVRYERSDLEERANTTVIEIAEGRAELKDIEERILSLLASSTGNILDNEALINALGEAKHTSENVTQNLEIAEATQKDIQAARERYRPIATRGSLIYTVIASIAGIEHMYQYSLDFFKRLFLQTLKRTERSEDVDERVATLLPAVTLDSYNTVCRGLFERDKQLFAFLMVVEIYRECGEIQPAEWEFFLKGCEGARFADPDSWPEWSNENSWNEVLGLCAVPPFENLKEDVWAHEKEWAAWVASDDAFKTTPPGYDDLSPVQQLLVLRAFREDLLMYGVTEAVGKYLGKAFTESPAFNLEASYDDSSTVSPIIFVLTAGTDPTATFTEFAEKKGFGDKKQMLSLGQDQGPKAKEMIANATKAGHWVYLQNCHVYASWMPALERLLEEIMINEKVHRDFRLWLTTMPTPAFPVLVLQSGVKVTKEPPKGLKANLKDSFLQEVTPDLWESCRNSFAWKRLLFSMSFFHAVVQERRKFGALGWNIPYEWNQSDFSASIKSLHSYLTNYEEVPWKALKYMIGVINYGGRVTDFLDARGLQCLLEKFFDPAVLQGQYDITEDGVYRVPEDISDLHSVKGYLDNLPPYETPELFGLHLNADITYNRNTSRRQLETILSVQPRTSTGGGLSTDEKVDAVAVEFMARLPPLIDKSEASPETYRITEDGTMVSLGTVASQEIDVFNAILKKLRRTLNELQRAIKGEVVMSAVLEAMYTAFLLGRVPDNWHEGSYLSRKPLASWFEDTLSRVEFLRDWNDNGPPLSYWLPGFFFPQGFLTGVLQTHSRSYKIPIDDIKFRTHVTHWTQQEQVEEPASTGVYIHGLYMEGARFDKDSMCVGESIKGELFTTVPIIWLEPVRRTEETARADTYACPLYKTTARAGALSTTGLSTNYVLSLDLNTGECTPTHWVQRGVALLCMLDD